MTKAKVNKQARPGNELAHALGVDGPGWTFDAQDQTWTILPRSLDVEAKFVAWVERQKRKSVFERKRFLPPDDYRELLSAVEDDIARGYYKWGKAGCNRWLTEDDGALQMALLMIQQKHPEMTLPRLAALIEENPEGFATAIQSAITDPNSQAPESPQTTPATIPTTPTV